MELLNLFTLDNKVTLSYDQAGPESGFEKFNSFKSHFSFLNQRNIKFTLHAGEACSGDNVLEAVKSGASRIGHGVRSGECDEAMKLVLERKVLFEMCPTSNI